jgi:hypothetical protein
MQTLHSIFACEAYTVNFFWPKFVLKRSNGRCSISTTDFGRILSKLAEIRPMVGFLCADLGEIRPVWKDFGHFWR